MEIREGGAEGAGTGGDGKDQLSEAAKKEVETMVNTAVNGALSSQLTRFKKSFGEEIVKTLGETLNPLKEQLTQMATAHQQAGQGVSATAKGALPPEIQQELARHEGRTKELEVQLGKERQAREQEIAAREKDRQAAMAKEERAELAGALRAKGLPEVQVKAAVALLHTEEKMVGRMEDGSIIFRLQKGTGAAKYVDEVGIETGVEEWLKTDDGKSFLPPRQVGGAGGQATRQTSRPNSASEARNEAVATLAKGLLGGGMG